MNAYIMDIITEYVRLSYMAIKLYNECIPIAIRIYGYPFHDFTETEVVEVCNMGSWNSLNNNNIGRPTVDAKAV